MRRAVGDLRQPDHGPGHRPGHGQAQTDAGGRAGQPHDRPLGQEQSHHLPARDTERAEDADLAPPARGGDGEDVEDEKDGDEDRLPAGQRHHRGEVLDEHLHLRAALGRRLHRVAPAQRRLQALPGGLERRPGSKHHVHAVEPLPPREGILGRVKVHQGDVAPEGGRGTFGTDQAADGERLQAVAGLERDPALTAQVMARSELLGQADGIGLSEEDQGIVEDLAAVAEVPVPQRTISQEIDAEDHE